MAKFDEKFEPHVEVIPEGELELLIASVEIRETEGGAGRGALITYNVESPQEYKGAFVTDFINYRHSNSQAQNIGRRSLDAICKQAGLKGIQELENTSQLEGKIVQATVAVEDQGQGYGPQPRVKKYLTTLTEQESEIPY